MIFIDTGAFVARFLERDQYHARAIEVWRDLEQAKLQCVTSNFVVDETLILLARKASYEFAFERAQNLYDSTNVRILRPTEADELAAIMNFGKFADQKVSFTDCVSFALMKRHGLGDVFTFDRHFALAGFHSRPLALP